MLGVGVGAMVTSGVIVEVIMSSVEVEEIVRDGVSTVVGMTEELEIEDSIEILVKDGLGLEILGVKVGVELETVVEKLVRVDVGVGVIGSSISTVVVGKMKVSVS